MDSLNDLKHSVFSHNKPRLSMNDYGSERDYWIANGGNPNAQLNDMKYGVLNVPPQGLSLPDLEYNYFKTVGGALEVLRKFGSDAHAYIPGVGMLNGLQAANYLDSAGTTAATVDQPVGLVLDAAGGLGVELVTNPASWSLGTNWVLSVSDIVYSGVSGDAASYSGILSLGKTYKVSFTASASFRVYVGNGNSVASSGGTYSYTLQNTDAGSSLKFVAQGSPLTVTGITCREVTGIHASQATTANKPILRRGAVNLLTWSNDLSNAAWGKSNISASANTAVRSNSSTAFLQSSAISIPIGSSGTFAVLAKAKSVGGAIGLRFTGSYPNRADAVFNLATGAIIGSASNAFTGQQTSVVGPDLNGYYLFVTSATVVGSVAVAGLTSPCELTAAVSGFEAGSAVLSDCYIGGAALFQGTYTAAQIQALGGIPLTTTAPASTALGPYSWQFDGVNDSLQLSSVPFQIADDFLVVGAMAPATNTGNQYLLSNRTGLNMIQCGAAGGAVDFFLRDAAGTQSRILGSTANAGELFVFTGQQVSGVRTLQKNGVLVGTDSTVLGASTISNSSIGFDNNTSYTSGSIYPIVAIKGTVNTSDKLLMTKLVGQMSGVVIP